MCWKSNEANKKVGAGKKQTRALLSEGTSFVGDLNVKNK